MESYKREFIQFLEKAGVLKFGDFTAKSGRKIPYFINAGMIKTGVKSPPWVSSTPGPTPRSWAKSRLYSTAPPTRAFPLPYPPLWR